MKISLIVPAYNEEKLIAETLEHIRGATAAFHRRGWNTELIVCDNNSTDRTAELARAGGARVVFEPVNQIARARNTGARAASGDWLIFIDADSHPGAELFGDVAEAIESGTCLAGGSTLRMVSGRWLARAVTRLWNLISRVTRNLAGSFIFCDAAVFRQLGGFSEALFVSEELELTTRLKQQAAASDRKLVILHRHPLVTSARKLHLYTPADYARFLWRTALRRGATFRSADDCHMWYDGRR